MPRDPLKLAQILYLDPFHGGSHAAFAQRLTTGLTADWRVLTLPSRHWKWRMRGAAVSFAAELADAPLQPDLIVATSMLSVTDLKGLVPQLAATPVFLYFHENQLAYPVREDQPRDHHFGFTQLVSARAATACAFNSGFNLRSFVAEGRRLLRALPDAVPPRWIEDIEAKSRVLPVPLDLPPLGPETFAPAPKHPDGPLILWNHRWEHDKRPEAFFAALDALVQRGRPFRVAIAGPRFEKWPSCFDEARTRLGDRVVHFGPCPDRTEYTSLLRRADVVISTAAHEFFGIAVLEATHFGAFALVPDRLAYPEIFPADHRYADDDTLVARLDALLDDWAEGRPLRADRRALTNPFIHPALAAFGETFSELTRCEVSVCTGGGR